LTTSYTCPVTNQSVNITTPITCTDQGVYLLTCSKDSGKCRQVVPTYVGECGDGENSSFTHRYATHLGSAIQPCQEDTVKPLNTVISDHQTVSYVYVFNSVLSAMIQGNTPSCSSSSD